MTFQVSEKQKTSLIIFIHLTHDGRRMRYFEAVCLESREISLRYNSWQYIGVLDFQLIFGDKNRCVTIYCFFLRRLSPPKTHKARRIGLPL